MRKFSRALREAIHGEKLFAAERVTLRDQCQNALPS
jgi:hypothetical protein